MAIKAYVKNEQTFYQVDIQVKSRGQRRHRIQKRKIGFLTLKEAQAAERQLRIQAIRDLTQRETMGCTWRALVESWKEALHQGEGTTKGVKKGTTSSYIQAVEDFTTSWMKRPALDITPADVEDLLLELTRQGYSNCRKYNIKTAINSVFRWGIRKRMLKGLTESPGYGIKISRKESKKPEILNLSEIRKLLETARSVNHPWQSIWTIALHTGMRSGELHALKWSNIDFETKRIKVETSYDFQAKKDDTTKGGYWREVPINSELDRILKELKLKSHGQSHVLPRIEQWAGGGAAKIIRAFCEEIGLPSICFHTLRACWATQLLRQKVAPIVVMKIGGWTELKVMQRYIRFAGLEIDGATDGLELLGSQTFEGQLISLFRD